MVSNAIFHFPRKVNYTYLPWVTYTDPELASIGMNEKSAKAKGINYSVWSDEFINNDRSLAEGEKVRKNKDASRRERRNRSESRSWGRRPETCSAVGGYHEREGEAIDLGIGRTSLSNLGRDKQTRGRKFSRHKNILAKGKKSPQALL